MNRPLAAAAIAAMLTSGCSAYHPSALSPAPMGPAGLVERLVTDRELADRYPKRAGAADGRFPSGAHVPPRRAPGTPWGVRERPAWTSTPLQREAERKSIDRDLPHSPVVPWGPAR